MKHTLKLVAILAFFICFSAGAVRADGTPELSYVLTGPVSATFLLPVNPTVDPGNSDGDFAFETTPINLVVNGVSITGDDVNFYNGNDNGGLSDEDGYFNLMNPNGVTTGLFTLPTTAPTMLAYPNGIPLLDFMSFDDGYTLTVTQVTAPEPSTLLLAGVGMLLLLLVRKYRAPELLS